MAFSFSRSYIRVREYDLRRSYSRSRSRDSRQSYSRSPYMSRSPSRSRSYSGRSGGICPKRKYSCPSPSVSGSRFGTYKNDLWTTLFASIKRT